MEKRINFKSNEYLFSPFQKNGEDGTIQKVIIQECNQFINQNNFGAKKRTLYIVSCYSDSNIEFYKDFFIGLFEQEGTKKLTDVKILFNTLKGR